MSHIRKLRLAFSIAIALFSLLGRESTASPLFSGDLLAADAGGIVRVNPSTGAHSIFSDVVARDIDAGAGAVFVTSGNSVMRIDPIAGVATTISTGGLLALMTGPLAVAPNGDIFVLYSQDFPLLGGVIKVTQNGVQSSVATGLDGRVVDLSVEPGGTILVATGIGFLYRVNPDTGTVQFLGDFDHTRAIDVSPGGALAQVSNGSVFFDGHLFPGFFPHPPFIPWGNGGPRDVTWDIGDAIFLESDLGLFRIHPDLSIDTLAPDVHGRITVFVPNGSSLWLVSLSFPLVWWGLRKWPW